MKCVSDSRPGRVAPSFLALLVAVGWLSGVGRRSEGAVGSVPLTIRSLGVAVQNAPVFTGMPFPPGALGDPERIDLVYNGQSVPRQVQALSFYPDGSVRVVLIGFAVTLAAGQTITAEVRYGERAGVPLDPPLAWTRNTAVRAMFPPRWYGESSVFNLRFLASADNTLAPTFEQRMRAMYTRTSDPPDTTNPDRRNYYDHTHALYTVLLRSGGPDSATARIWEEVAQYREREILHSGPYIGQYSAGSYTNNTYPIDFAVVRRMFPQGLLEDYYFTGDPRSLAVAREIGDALLKDAYTAPTSRFTWTERIPGWEIMGLCGLYEATLDGRYLEAARHLARIEMDHQDAMAVKYPNQGGVPGQTGGFIQDRNGQWYDAGESTASGCGSPFMTTLLCEGLIRLYWLTGDERVKQSVLRAADWLADAAFVAASHPENLTRTDSFWYICRDPANDTVYPGLNPMFLQMLGFAHQATGDPKYLALAKRILAFTDWGSHIKEFNQAMHSSGQGLYLLSHAPGTVPLVWNQGADDPPPAPPGGRHNPRRAAIMQA